MGTKTVTRLGILIGIIALAGGAGRLTWRYQVDRMSQGVIAQAERAEKAGDDAAEAKAKATDYARAERLYRGHLAVVPDDVEVMVKYADLLLKQEQSQRRQQEAMGLYTEVLRRLPGRVDVRRRLAELAIKMGQYEVARPNVANLLQTAKDDGKLNYLMGRCDERDNEAAAAVKHYRAAVAGDAPGWRDDPERLDATQRLATLLRRPLGRPAEADAVIEKMVQSEPGDYRVYLARGRYRDQLDLPGAGDDFRKALELAPDRPDVCLEAARVAEREKGLDAARQILDKGLAVAPKDADLYVALADLELRADRIDRAIDALELGIKAVPGQLGPRAQLALILANRGDTGRLNLQIEELERLGAGSLFTMYLKACFYFNNHEFVKARRLLVPLQVDVGRDAQMKTWVNTLLARCYGELNEPALQRDAELRAFSADPDDIVARHTWIQGLIKRGEVDEAIREYQQLLSRQPGLVRLPLASLLIERNRRLPPSRREWGEVEALIDAAAAASPGSVDPALVRAQVFLEQGQESKAFDALETARARFPRSPGPWIAEADLLARQKKFEEGMGVLDRARRQLGDRVDLRLARARLWEAKGGPQAAAALRELAGDLESFGRDDRRALLTALATELGRQQDLAGAVALWSRLAEMEPEGLLPRLQMFDLALQLGDRRRAEEEVGVINRLDDQFGRYCRAQYLAWQAGRDDATAREKLRSDARVLLNELKARRPDWALIPLALARLDEQDLERGGLDAARKRERREELIASYRRAIELGIRDLAIMRHVVALLFEAGRGSEALQLYNQIPAAGQMAGELGRIASEFARANRDFNRAVEIARRAVAAHPEDFQERLWLAQILLEAGRPGDAEQAIREAVDASRGDPDRWITLVRLLIMTRQPDKAAEAVRQAEASLAGAPLALAQCCQLIGNAYAAADRNRAGSWYGQARQWLLKAQAEVKDPDDLRITRRLAEFLLQTGQFAEAEKPLGEILARAAGGKSPDIAAWARRGLAMAYIAGDPPRVDRALALFGDPARGAAVSPDDLSILARVHNARGTPEGRRQAIAELESLVDRNIAGPEDRFLLARLVEGSGPDQWPRARELYRELILRTGNARDMETLGRRPDYLAGFAEALLRHHEPGDDSDLAEAREVVEKLEPIAGASLRALALGVQLDKAARRPDKAAERILAFAARPGLSAADRRLVAGQAEQLDVLDAAEAICRRLATEPPAEPNLFLLPLFLVRHGRLKEAIDYCEPLWADEGGRELVAGLCIQAFGESTAPLDAEQLNRVAGWIERARARKPQSVIFALALGRLREMLGDYPKAEEMYRAAARINDIGGVASNNLAQLIVLRRKDGGGIEALELINGAINSKGPVPALLDTRGVVYLSVGDSEHAIADLEAAVKAAPSPAKYFHLAQAYLLAKDVEKARKALEAGKAGGLPAGLHRLELAAYHQTLGELKVP